MKAFLIFLTAVCIILFGILFKDQKFLSPSYSLNFNEFIQSSDFDQLAQDNIHTFNYRVNGGTYNLGVPFSPYNETVYGTNRGVRVIPLVVFLNLLQKVLSTFWDRIYFIIILVAPLVGFYLAAKFFFHKKEELQVIVSSLFFAFNPWVFSRLETGFWQLHIAYACLPFIYFAFISFWKREYDKVRLQLVISTILASSLAFYFQPHFLIMLMFPLGVYYLYKAITLNWGKRHVFVLSSTILVFVGFLILNAYQIIPSLLFKPLNVTAPGQFFSIASVRFNGSGSQLSDILRLSPRSPLNLTKTFSLLDYLNYGFFIFAFVSLLLFLRNKKSRSSLKSILFLIFTVVFYIVLAKGVNSPFSKFSELFYDKIPVMHLFRDPSRFYAMIGLFLSIILFSIPLNNLTKRILYSCFAFFLVGYLVLSARHLDKNFSYLSIPNFYNKLPISNSNSRLFTVPDNIPLSGYTWFTGSNTGINNSPFVALIPLHTDLANFSSTLDSYFSQLIYYVENNLTPSGNTNLLSRLGANSVMIDKNISSTFKDNNLATSSAKLFPAPQFSLLSSNNNVLIYKKAVKTSLFSDRSPVFLIDNLKGFDTLSKKIPPEVPIILLDQSINLNEFMSHRFSGQTIVYENKQEVQNLFLTSLEAYSLHLEQQVWNYDKDWNPNEPYISPQIASGEFFTSGRSVSTTKDKGKVTFIHYTKPGDYIVALRSLKNNTSGSIIVQINNQKYIQNDNSSDLEWKTLGKVHMSSKNTISILNVDNSLAIIDDLVVVPTDVYKARESTYEQVLRRNRLVPMSQITDKFQLAAKNVDYIQKNYSTWNLTSSSRWITMNFPFGYEWKIDNQEAKFIGNYYGMTFLTNNNKQKKVSYDLETLFQGLLILSVITGVGMVFVLLKTSSK